MRTRDGQRFPQWRNGNEKRHRVVCALTKGKQRSSRGCLVKIHRRTTLTEDWFIIIRRIPGIDTDALLLFRIRGNMAWQVNGSILLEGYPNRMQPCSAASLPMRKSRINPNATDAMWAPNIPNTHIQLNWSSPDSSNSYGKHSIHRRPLKKA